MGSTEFQERQDILQSLILRLHKGEDWDAVQADFKKHFTGVSAYEISVMEQGLIGKGIDAEDIQRLCITAPPKVMWGVIRSMFQSFKTLLQNEDFEAIPKAFSDLKYEMTEMITKEEDILLPMITDIFNEDHWLQIAKEFEEIGYCIVKPEAKWVPERSLPENVSRETNESENDAYINFETGHLTPHQLEKMLNNIPLELTFVDADNIVRYYNDNGEEKFFKRTVRDDDGKLYGDP